MRLARFLTVLHLTLVLVVLLATPAAAQNKGKKDKGNRDGVLDVVGTNWHYKLTRGDKIETGNFRVYKLEIFKGKDKIGVVKPKDEDESSLVFTDFPELNGKATIRKVHDKVRVWKGTLVRPNDQKWDLEIEVQDR